ncbi:MAG: branched-chain amino acid ABC transporter permease [archaeon]|nr:branched-chain amino acid ABC transporter permease [archaeon]
MNESNTKTESNKKSPGQRRRSIQLNPYVLLVWLALFLILALAPRFVNSGLEAELAELMLYISLAQSFNLFTGLTGYVNFGNVVFYGIGGYGLAIATALWNMPPLLGVLLGGVFSAILALGMSFPTLRLRGAYFAIGTLAIEQAIFVIFDNWSYVNRAAGLTLPILDYQPTQTYYTLLLVAVATIIVLTIVMKSRLGLALSAIRQQEETALSIGVNATLYKTIAFVLSGFLAGLAGAAWFWNVTIVEPTGAFTTDVTLTVISMALLGGLGTFFGPVIGAAILEYIDIATRQNYPYIHLIVFGIIIIAVVLIIPDGIVGFAEKAFRRSPIGKKLALSKSLSSSELPSLKNSEEEGLEP